MRATEKIRTLNEVYNEKRAEILKRTDTLQGTMVIINEAKKLTTQQYLQPMEAVHILAMKAVREEI